ncbi:hypothetical protein HZ326_15123 [Fusarium oxysporum f. sp. albedinis]|nr:hypothetical protein HZ326_15123 [Fusarium oxysporum f. sp. albedinis]
MRPSSLGTYKMHSVDPGQHNQFAAGYPVLSSGIPVAIRKQEDSFQNSKPFLFLSSFDHGRPWGCLHCTSCMESVPRKTGKPVPCSECSYRYNANPRPRD